MTDFGFCVVAALSNQISGRPLTVSLRIGKSRRTASTSKPIGRRRPCGACAGAAAPGTLMPLAGDESTRSENRGSIPSPTPETAGAGLGCKRREQRLELGFEGNADAVVARSRARRVRRFDAGMIGQDLRRRRRGRRLRRCRLRDSGQANPQSAMLGTRRNAFRGAETRKRRAGIDARRQERIRRPRQRVDARRDRSPKRPAAERARPVTGAPMPATSRRHAWRRCAAAWPASSVGEAPKPGSDGPKARSQGPKE